MSESKASKLSLKVILSFCLLGIVLVMAMFWGVMDYRVSPYNLVQLQGRYPILQYDYSDGDSMKIRREFSRGKPADWVDLSGLPSGVWSAVVISEDWAFFEHRGMDWLQIWRAIRNTLFSGSRLRGASTLSQQVVKNLFLTHDRSLWRKLDEAWLAVKLEDRLSKKEILEIYLNIVEWGEGIVGLRQASLYYFSKQSYRLTPEESAFLAFLLPSPVRYSTQLPTEEKLREFSRERMQWILEGMTQEGYVESNSWSAQSIDLTIRRVLGEVEDEMSHQTAGTSLPKAVTDAVNPRELEKAYENLDAFIEESLSDPAQVDEPGF